MYNTTQQRYSRGIVIALLVILTVHGLIVTAVVLVTPSKYIVLVLANRVKGVRTIARTVQNIKPVQILHVKKQRAKYIKGLIWSPLEPKTESCFSSNIFYSLLIYSTVCYSFSNDLFHLEMIYSLCVSFKLTYRMKILLKHPCAAIKW